MCNHDPVWLIAPDASIKCEHWERLVCVDGDVIYAWAVSVVRVVHGRQASRRRHRI